MSLIHFWSFSEFMRCAFFSLFFLFLRLFSLTLTMVSSTNSSYSSSISSGPHSPYQHPQPTSSLSLDSQRRRSPMPVKYPRFYASPLDEGTDSTPLQVYGYEQREPSINGKPPKLLRRVSHALGDIREDFTLQLDPPQAPLDRHLRHTTLPSQSRGPHDLRRPTAATHVHHLLRRHRSSI